MGAESNKAKRPELQENILKAHILAVRRMPGFESAVVVFVPENNLGFEAQRMEHMMRRSQIPDVVTVDEDDGKAGIATTKQSKKIMAVLMNRTLLDRRVKWHHNFVTVDEDHTPDEMKALLIKELRGYRRILEPSKDPHGDPKEKFSGKQSGGYDGTFSFSSRLPPTTHFFKTTPSVSSSI